MEGLGRARVLLDAGFLTSLGLAKPLMIAVCTSVSPPSLALDSFAGASKVPLGLVSYRTLVQPSQKS